MTARSIAKLSWCAILLAAGNAVADDQADARAIIDQAIDFAGGREALARYEKPFGCQQEGTAMGGGFKRKLTTHLPDRSRSDQTSDGGATFVLVFDGEDGWVQSNGSTKKMIDLNLRLTRERLYAEWLCTLLPLDDEEFQLATVAEIMVEGRPALGVKVSRQERPDVTLYFDKDTFALVKQARTANGRPFEEFYDDYAELDGLVYPEKIVQYGNGNKLFEVRTTEIKFLDSVPDDTFEKP